MRFESALAKVLLAGVLVVGCLGRPDSGGEPVAKRAGALTADPDGGAGAACSSTGTPAIEPDKEDYAPPTDVILTATGLGCGASYSVRLTTPTQLWPVHIPGGDIINLPAQTADDHGTAVFVYHLGQEVAGNWEVELLDADGNVVADTHFHDSHFRYSHLTWTQVGAPSARTVAFTLTAAFRRSAFTCSSSPLGCGADGFPVTGNVFSQNTGNIQMPPLNFGDGQVTQPLAFVATAYDAANDWVLGVALNPGSNTQTTVTHTYGSNGPFTAFIQAVARLTTIQNTTTNGDYRNETTVRFDVADSSPVSSLPPIINAPTNAPGFNFTVPRADADGDVTTCRLATCSEEFIPGGTCTPPPGISVNATTCVVSWSTVGRPVGQLWTTQVMIEGRRNGTLIDKVGVDFIIQVVAADAHLPVCTLDQFSAPPASSTPSTATLNASVGTALSFRVNGTDVEGTVGLNSGGIPGGATLAPGLPISGASPQRSTFSWTPALTDGGATKVVTFTVTDQVGQQAACSATIRVASPCPENTACNDGNPCTQTDVCHNNVCVGSNPVVCVASDQCHAAGTCDTATGVCSNPVLANGTACNDGNACTQSDSCQAGVCTGSNAVTCAASDQCHVAGTCDPATGACSNPTAADGTGCTDGNACTQSDTCQAGTCVGSNPVTCAASDQCHVAGTCDTATGVCSNPAAANGTGCTDGNACTQSDSCQAGACVGANPVVCAASDQCHVAGTCDTATGVCSNPAAADGTGCTDRNACTRTDSCQAGACIGANPVVCAASDQCHEAGACDTATGVCSDPASADGKSCSDSNACTTADACVAGVCTGGAPPNCNDTNPCTVDSCDTATGCVNAPGNAGSVCRAATSACDSAELCSGTSANCPAPADTSAPTLGVGTDQTVVGNCTGTAIAYAKPVASNAGANQCDAGAVVTCTPVPGNSYGDHVVTCSATDASGNVSNAVSFHVNVLQPLSLKIQPPLYGDNGTMDNVAKAGSTVPVKVVVYACGTDVTPSASLTLKIGVQTKQSSSDPGVNVVPTFNGAGDTGGVMIWDGAQYHYNLNTKGYPVTANNAAFFQLNITASYNSNPSVVVGTDAVMLDTK